MKTAWYLLRFDLLIDPRIHVLLGSFTPSSRLQLCSSPSPLCAVETLLSTSRHWTTVSRKLQVGAVFAVKCKAACIEDMRIRVTLHDNHACSTPTAVLDLVSMLDPGQQAGADGGGGVLFANMRAGKATVGNLALRAVVAPVVVPGKAFGMLLDVICSASVRREVRGVVMRLIRLGGGRQSLPLGEAGVVGRGGRFSSVNVGKAVVWFGLGDGAARGAVLRLEWVRERNSSCGTSSNQREQTVVAQKDLALSKILRLRKGTALRMSWTETGCVPQVMMIVIDNAQQSPGRVEMRMRLTR